MMSKENLEIVRSAYDVPYGGDEWLARVDKFVASDCEVEDRTLPGVAQGLSGPAAMRAEATHMREAFEDISYAVEDLVDLDDRVLVRVRGSGRGRGSGIRIDGTLGHLLRLRGGKVVRLDVYGTWQEAIEAARLSESAMSEENVAVVRAFVDAYNRGESDAAVELCTPDVEGYPASVFPEPRTLIGHAEMKAFLEEIGNAWAESPEYALTEAVAVGDARVVVRGDWRGRGAASAIESSSEWSMVWTIREHQIARIAWFSDHNEALEAARLSE